MGLPPSQLVEYVLVPPDIIVVESSRATLNYTVGLGHVVGTLIFDKFPSLLLGTC